MNSILLLFTKVITLWENDFFNIFFGVRCPNYRFSIKVSFISYQTRMIYMRISDVVDLYSFFCSFHGSASFWLLPFFKLRFSSFPLFNLISSSNNDYTIMIMIMQVGEQISYPLLRTYNYYSAHTFGYSPRSLHHN